MTGPFSSGGGEKVARKYELVYILNPALGEEAVDAIVERIQALIESSATIDQVDVWGRRRLAYEIDYQKGLLCPG